MSHKSQEGVFSPYANHWFGKDDAARVELSPKADNQTVVFMILFLMYMEIKREDSSVSPVPLSKRM